MAGQISDDAVIWVAGESTGVDETGITAADLPIRTVVAGTGAPTSTPTGTTLYVRLDTLKLYIWDDTSWLTVSGA